MIAALDVHYSETAAHAAPVVFADWQSEQPVASYTAIESPVAEYEAGKLVEITRRLQSATEEDRDQLRQQLRIGLHWNTQVTLAGCNHLVSQAYCSALPVAYSPYSDNLWAEFAKLVLEASYEATFCAAIQNASVVGNNSLYLTLLGGGAFGNDIDWIIAAIARSVQRYQDYDLDVAIVSYGAPNAYVQQLVT